MTNIQSSGIKLSTQSQLNDNYITNLSPNTINNKTGLSDEAIVGINSTNKTTEDKLKSIQSPLDSFLSTTDNLTYDSFNAVADNTDNSNTAKDTPAYVKENGVFFGKYCEKALGTLLAKSPTFRELYGKINSSGGWTWVIEVNNSFPVAAGTTTEKTLELGLDGSGIIKTYVNPTKTGRYTTVDGKELTASLERLLAHEIGHVIGRIEEGRSHSVTESSYDKAIEVENTIMGEIYSNAPLRDIYDPLHRSQRPRP